MAAKFDLSQFTHVGGRKFNQDFCAYEASDCWACFVLCDGLGGHMRGDIAAKEFCEAIISNVEPAAIKFRESSNDSLQVMHDLILQSSTDMQLKIMDEYGGIDSRTTFAVAFIDKDQMITAHQGDSRIYRLNPTEIVWRSKDHSYLQALYEAGQISKREMSRHPAQNKLLRALGIFGPPNADIIHHSPLEPEEVLILCSDGFWEECSLEWMLSLVSSKDLSSKLDKVGNEIVANAGSSGDNVTAQVVQVLWD